MRATQLLREGGFENLIVGVTGNVLEDDVAEYLNSGADMVLAKPLKFGTLSNLFCFIKEEGFQSRKGMVLVDQTNSLQWTLRVYTK